MPKKKTVPEMPALTPRGRRAHQQQGFYSALLKGKKATPKPEVSSKKTHKSATRKAEAASVSKGEPATDKQSSAHHSKQQQPEAELAIPSQDVEIKTQESKVPVQNVVAVVQDDTVSSKTAKGFLHSESSPWQHDAVTIEQSEGQLTVKGTIEQVQLVLQQLAKIKSKAEMVPPSASEVSEKEHPVSSICTEGVKEEAVPSIPHSVKTVYIKSGSGADLPVTVEIPPHQHSFSKATENSGEMETGAEAVVYAEAADIDNLIHSCTDEHGSNSTRNVSSRTLEGESLVERGISSEKISQKSRTSELIDKLSEKTSAADLHSPVTDGREAPRRKGSNSLQALPSAMPGLLPLEGAARCGLCSEECASEDDVKQHMGTTHASREEAMSCEVCNLVFPDKRRLLVHLRIKHEAANLTCQICGKQFQCQRYLRTHLQRHAGVKKFECLVCGWRFFERHKLRFHMELHKAESERCLPYRCELCGKQFANKATWSDHCNTHSGLRPFGCDVCGAKFSHRVGLRRHKLTHEKVKPFSCNRCSKTFAVKPKLDEHMITHTGISKHTCVICEKVFTAATSLRRHTLKCTAAATLTTETRTGATVHTTNTTPTPDSAGGDFVTMDTLDTQESEQAVFLCGDCNACFVTYEEAEQHTLTHLVAEEPDGGMVPEDSSHNVEVLTSAVDVTSGEREISVSVEELKQIQLAANTLADLSTM